MSKVDDPGLARIVRASTSAQSPRHDSAECSPGLIQPVRRATYLLEIVNAIADLLMKGVWRPGDMIPSEKELAARFGVGRSTIREAVKSLVVLGVLEARAGEGSFVREPDSHILTGAFRWGLLLSQRNIKDLVEVRRLIEADCAAQAARQRTPGDVDRLCHLIDLMALKQNDHEDFMRYDNQFHIDIANIGGNILLTSISSTIQTMVGIWYPITYYAPRMKALTLAEHQAIVDAIRQADPSGAAAAMRRHIDRAAARLGKALSAKR